MTMIACTLNKATPVLIGDLLISTDIKVTGIELPVLSEDVTQYLSADASLHPLRLDQKIYILKENVCIGFAGGVAEIKSFLEDITIYCKAKDQVSALDMQWFLQQHSAEESWQETSFVILVTEREVNEISLCKFVHGQWIHTETELFGEAWATGSGATDFLKEAKENAKLFSTFSMNDAEFTIQANLITIGRLLANERKTLNTVKHHWGAGFEMIYYDGSRFRKVDEITYVINWGRYNSAGGIPDVPVPSIIMNYKYYGELLLITVLRPLSGTTEEADTSYIIRSDKVHRRKFVVAPFNYKGNEDFDSLGEDYSFESHVNVMSYVLETEGNYYIPASFNIGSELSVRFQQPGTIELTMLKPINDRLTEEVKKVVAQEKK